MGGAGSFWGEFKDREGGEGYQNFLRGLLSDKVKVETVVPTRKTRMSWSRKRLVCLVMQEE